MKGRRRALRRLAHLPARRIRDDGPPPPLPAGFNLLAELEALKAEEHKRMAEAEYRWWKVERSSELAKQRARGTL